MTLSFTPFTILLRERFTLASGSRSTTPAVLVQVEQDGLTGYGEASMPPYLGESVASVSAFLRRVNLDELGLPMDLGKAHIYVDALAPGNHAAKAAVDIALHDWVGKKAGLPWFRIWGLDPSGIPPTSFTVGIGSGDEIRRRATEAAEFPILKLKMGGEGDREMMKALRSVTDRPVRVDVNQGWSSKNHALGMIEWLATMNVELVEQPMPVSRVEDQRWLRERSPLPIVADEAVSRIDDMRNVADVYDGINIKLMKCTGLWEASRMADLARKLGMRVMLGCMTETSCAISAAAQLSPLADWVDLDGALLISNDPFRGVEIREGKIILDDRPGIGVEKRSKDN